jgi:hypothetical protein
MSEKKIQPKELFHFIPDEVSLVKDGANQKTVFLTKSANGMQKVMEKLEGINWQNQESIDLQLNQVIQKLSAKYPAPEANPAWGQNNKPKKEEMDSNPASGKAWDSPTTDEEKEEEIHIDIGSHNGGVNGAPDEIETGEPAEVEDTKAKKTDDGDADDEGVDSVTGVKPKMKKTAELPTPTLDEDSLMLLKISMGCLEALRGSLPEGFSMSMGNQGMQLGIYKANEMISKTAAKAKVEKSLADINELHIAEIAVITKNHDEIIQKTRELIPEVQIQKFETILKGEAAVEPVQISKEAQAALVQKDAEILALTQQVEATKEKETTAAFVQKAEKELSKLGDPAKLGNILKKASSVLTQDDYLELEEIFKFAQGQIDAGDDITKEIGTVAVDVGSKDGRIEKMAEDLVKADPTLTKEKAFTQLMKTKPELFTI